MCSTIEEWSKFAKVYDPIKIGSIDGTDVNPHDRAIERALNSTYVPNRHVKGRPECTIFVSRLSYKTTKEDIKEAFSKYGKLRRFRLVKDIVTGMPKGYAFIEYEEEHDAEEAYRLANKMTLDGNVIFVDFECERLLKGWKPRRLGGGFGGKKESGQLRFGGRDRPFRKPISLELMIEEERKERERRRAEHEKEYMEQKMYEKKKAESSRSPTSPHRKSPRSPPRYLHKRSLNIGSSHRLPRSSPDRRSHPRDTLHRSPLRNGRRSPPRISPIKSPYSNRPLTSSPRNSPNRRSPLKSPQRNLSRNPHNEHNYDRNLSKSPHRTSQSSTHRTPYDNSYRH